jgi:hypothetical protein
MRAMRGWLVVLVAFYLALDLANPLMPGALNFDADDTVDAVRGHRDRARLMPAFAALPPARPGDGMAPEPRVRASVPRLVAVPPVTSEARYPRRLPPAGLAEADLDD